jgi:hypothetical protein
MGVAVFCAGALGSAACNEAKKNQKDIDTAVKAADKLYEQGKHKEISVSSQTPTHRLHHVVRHKTTCAQWQGCWMLL